MIYLRLHDRLGNILFMIATALHLDNDVSLFCNNEKDLRYVQKLVKFYNLPVKIGAPKHHIENCFEYYTPTVYKTIPYDGSDMILDGYFQSYRYFKREDVLKLFKCPDDLSNAIEDKWGEILHNYQTVSIHVRRGDYLKLPERFPFVGKAYIKKAMKCFSDSNTAFIFTSDDITWCKKNFKGKNIYYSENQNEYFDLYLASKCNHNILSNSTFSYWGGVFKQA